MSRYNELLKIYESEVRSALGYLEYSYLKIQNQLTDLGVEPMDPEVLETWESFSARFSRTSDIFMSKYIRARVQSADPAYRGELRDYIDQAEKIGLISDSERWMQIRELRNKITHEYSQQDLSVVFRSIYDLTPFLITELKKVFP